MRYGRVRSGGAAALVAAAACGGDPAPNPAASVTTDVALITVDTATVAIPLALPAQLYVEHDAYVYARSTGIVEVVRADIGDRVRRGDVLAQLENIDQEIALEDAEASAENTQRVLRRIRELAGTGAVTVADSEQAELDARQSQLRVRQARRDLELTRAHAPFAGVVTGRTVRRGQFVEQYDSLFRVTGLEPLRASVQLPEQAGRVAAGTAVEVATLSGAVYPATVERASPTIDPRSGTREVIVQLAPGSELQPGASVIVRLGAEPRTIVVIPQDAIAEDGYVLVREEGRTVLRAVRVGEALADGRLEIVSGLTPGEVLVRPTS